MIRKAGMLIGALGLTALLGSCSMVNKLVKESPPGRFAYSYFRTGYCQNINKDFFIAAPDDLYSRITGADDKVLLLVHGFGASSESMGSLDDPNSPLSIASAEFDGKVLVANYPSQFTIDEIADNLLQKLEEIKNGYSGEFPRLYVLAHSMGGQVERSMVRERPSLFKEVALVASPCDGADFGLATGYLAKHYEELLDLDNGGRRTSLDDLFKGSDYFRHTNTCTQSLGVTYDFFVFVSKDGRGAIPGPDDTLVPLDSAYPYSEILRGNFEDVGIRNVVEYYGDVNHHTLLRNGFIMRDMLRRMKSGYPVSKIPPRPENITRIYIPRASDSELQYREGKLDFKEK